MRKPTEIFEKTLLDKLGWGPRTPFYHTEGRIPTEPEMISYSHICYRATENNKPKFVLEIDITIEQFLNNQDILKDLEEIEESDRKFFRKEKKYLWVIDEYYELLLLPEITQNPEGDRGHICHTNITGGSPARHGGELWYGKDSIVFLNNFSGRFYTNDKNEWLAVVDVFIKAGYKKVVDIDLRKNDIPVIYEK